MKEADIEQRVCYYAKSKYGILTDKFTSPNRRSVPDRIFSAPNGRVFFIEFKAVGKKPTAQQLRDHSRRRALGQHIYVVDNTELGKKIIDYETVYAALSSTYPTYRS